METSKDLFKELEIAEKLFLDGSIKIAQKKFFEIFKDINGSAVDFVDAIKSSGIEEQNEPRKFMEQ